MSRVVLIAGLLLALSTAPAEAAFTSTLTGTSATLTGTSANDVLEITSTTSSGTLRHNRFAAGDPGFASDSDWNTSVGGVQSLNGSGATQVAVNTSSGDDALRVGTATFPAENVDAAVTFNAGSDDDSLTVNNAAGTLGREFTWNFENMVLPAAGLSVDYTSAREVDVRLGTGPDTVRVTWTSSTVEGEISAGDGNDTFTLESAGGTLQPFNAPSFRLFGGNGADSATFTDSGNADPEQYFFEPFGFKHSAHPPITLFELEAVTLNTGSGSNDVLKNAGFPLTLNLGGGDDDLLTSDGVADTVNCGAGLDSVIADSIDTLSGCELFPRAEPAPAPPAQQQEQQQQQVPPDELAPTVTVRLPKAITKRKLLRGITVTLTPSEASSIRRGDARTGAVRTARTRG